MAVITKTNLIKKREAVTNNELKNNKREAVTNNEQNELFCYGQYAECDD